MSQAQDTPASEPVPSQKDNVEDVGLDAPPTPTADVLELARAELVKLPAAVQGKGGRAQTWDAVVLVRKLGLDPESAADMLLREYNHRCRPPWPEADIRDMCRRAHGGGRTAPTGQTPQSRLSADPDLLDRAYRLLLARLPLNHSHAQGLRERGLADADVARLGYRSWTTSIDKLKSILLIIAEAVGAERAYEVPGILRTDFGPEFNFRQDALVVPVRDVHGRIIGLRLRVETPRFNKKGLPIKGPKGNPVIDKAYLWLSGRKDHKEDARVAACGHVPLHESDIVSIVVRITEGEIKADIATLKTGVLTISVPGVTNWRVVLPILKSLGAKRVLIAYDADSETNRDVARSILDTYRELTAQGYEVGVETWNGKKCGKGIDDVAMAGHLDQVLTREGDDARAWLDELAARHGLPGRLRENVWEGDPLAAAEPQPGGGGSGSRPPNLGNSPGRDAVSDRSASSPPPAGSTTGGPGDGGSRPAILVTVDEMRVNDEAVAALSRDANIYARGNRLVRVLSARMDRLPVETLREHLASAARWFVWTTKGEGEWVPCHPPAWSIQAVDKRGRWEGIRELSGVVTYPTLLPDGRLLTTLGYDTGSGLLYLPEGTWDVPAKPSRQDALDAIATLRGVVAQFPWQEPIDFAAWLAELLTVVGRHAIRGPYPMFAHSANVKGTGKGKLAQVIAVIATGETVAEGKLPDDEDEREKRMTGISVSGRPYVLFDEAADVAGPSLQMVATSRRISGRILGETGDYVGPWDAVVVFAANNLQIAQDMIRRVVPVRLLSPLEKPWERQDLEEKNLLACVAERRQELLTAALVILRAYVAAGRPQVEVGALGSYEDWTALVASALVWLGLPDVTKAVAQDEADTERATILAFMTAWRNAIGLGKTLLSAEARTYAELGTKPDDTDTPDGDVVTDVSLPPERPSTANPRTTFVKALCTFCPPRASADLPSAAAIGHALKKIKNRVVAGMRFTSRQDTHTKLHGWTLQPAEVAGVAENQPPQAQVPDMKGVAEVAEDAEVDLAPRAGEGHLPSGEGLPGSIQAIQRTGDQPPHPPQPPQGQSVQAVTSAEVEFRQPPQPPQMEPTSAPRGAPSPTTKPQATHRAHVREVRVERWLPPGPDEWSWAPPHPADLRLVVQVALEDGATAYYVQVLHPIHPEWTMQALASFGGELGADGRWVMRAVSLLVNVRIQHQMFLGDVSTVVAVSVLPDASGVPTPDDGDDDDDEARRIGAWAAECEEDVA